MLCDEFFKVNQGVAMNAPMCQEEQFYLEFWRTQGGMQGFEDGCDVFMFMLSHQDPGSSVLYLLELFNTLARDSDDNCVTVV